MNQQVVKGAQRKFRLLSTTYIYAGDVVLPARGTRIDGGGMVTDVGDRRFTVEYAAASDPIYKEVKGVETTVVCKWGPDDPDRDLGHFVPFFGFHVGDLFTGGGTTGTVTAVTGTEVTITFPTGVPAGPIRLPGVETTVVEEPAPTNPEGTEGLVHAGAPFELGQVVTPGLGDEAVGVQIGTEVAGIRTRFELKKPGSLENSVRIDPKVLEKPRNDSTCACAVFIASFDASGVILDPPTGTMLVPGETIDEYRPPAGAASIRFACSGGCPNSECGCSISILSPLVG